MIKKAYFLKGSEFAAKELADEIIKWAINCKVKGGVVGLSGGIDSTTVAYLCKFAFDKHNRENPKNKLTLHGVILPSKVNQKKDEEDGVFVAKKLGITYDVVPIQPIANQFIKAIPNSLKKDYDIGNLFSETRAVILSRTAASKNCLVMGTGNRDEDYVLGYFTKRGDGAVDNNILGNVPKRLVRELAAWLGVPEKLVKRVPTAGLWTNQTDEGELGYTYDQAEIIQNGFDEGRTPEEIAELTGYYFKVINDVVHRHKDTEHKRQAPPVGKITLEYK